MLIFTLWACQSNDTKPATENIQHESEDTADTSQNREPVITIEKPRDTDRFNEYEEVFFQAQISDDHTAAVDLTVLWESDLQGILDSQHASSDGSISYSRIDLLPGEHTISLSVADEENSSSTQTFRIEIIDQIDEPSISIVAPIEILFAYNHDIVFSVSVSDGQDIPSDLMLSFTSTLDGEFCTPIPDGIGTASCTTQLSIGSHQITYTVKDQHGYTSSVQQDIDIRLPEDIDDDGDGYTENMGDCDDYNPLTSPIAEESCDFADNDCDGSIDEDSIDGSMYYKDNDEDGYGDPNQSTVLCNPQNGYVFNNQDCNDEQALAWTGNTETCDDIDNNCDGQTDEGLLNTYYADNDGDERGDPDSSTEACSLPSGYVENANDCNDNEPAAWTGHWEFCADNIDNDCNGAVDEGGLGCSTFYADEDEDGYGNANLSDCLCVETGYYTTTNAMDCDDTEPATYPGAAYLESSSACMQDRDLDGYGGDIVAPQITPGSDCFDYNADVFPGQTDFFIFTRGDGSYDYDCDGTEEIEFSRSHNGITVFSGWQSTVPDCGELSWWCSGSFIPPVLTYSCWPDGYWSYPNKPQTTNYGSYGDYIQSCR